MTDDLIKIAQEKMDFFGLKHDELLGYSDIENLFSINSKQCRPFLYKHKIDHKSTAKTNSGKGFKYLFSVYEIIYTALKNNDEITKPFYELIREENAKKEQEENYIIAEQNRKLNDEINKKRKQLSDIEESINTAKKKLKAKMDDPLFEEDDILLLAGIRKRKCGVYFLIKDEEIVYVGQSVNIFSRIGAHETLKDFDTFTYIECDKSELNIIEAKYIVKFKPKYNFSSLGNLILPVPKHLVFEVD